MLAPAGFMTGIDLGTRGVKLVRARAGGRAGKLLNAGIGEISATGPDEWPAAAARALATLLREQKLKPRDLGRVAAAVSGPAVHLRQVDLPPLGDAELRTSLKYEARKHLPLENPAEAALDCQILSRPAGDQPMSVLLVGTAEALVQSRVEVLKKVGIDPEIVDAAPLALLNGLHGQPDGNGHPWDTAAVFDLGAASTTIVMARRGGVVYSRSLPLSGDALLDAVARSTAAADREAAENEKRRGMEPGAPGAATLRGHAEALAGAFRETAQFYSLMNERRKVDRIFLAGGDALLPGIDRLLGDSLGVPVSKLDLTEALNYSPAETGHFSREHLHHVAPRLAVALGLLYWGDNNV